MLSLSEKTTWFSRLMCKGWGENHLLSFICETYSIVVSLLWMADNGKWATKIFPLHCFSKKKTYYSDSTGREIKGKMSWRKTRGAWKPGALVRQWVRLFYSTIFQQMTACETHLRPAKHLSSRFTVASGFQVKLKSYSYELLACT